MSLDAGSSSSKENAVDEAAVSHGWNWKWGLEKEVRGRNEEGRDRGMKSEQERTRRKYFGGEREWREPCSFCERCLTATVASLVKNDIIGAVGDSESHIRPK